MIITKFEDIIAWQKAKILSIDIYKNIIYCRDYSFKDQIQRACLSIMNNIAEGFERRTNKELINFLFIAKGSSAEVRSMLYPALELNYITKNKFNEWYTLTIDISRLLSGFIETL
ncbi:MAG: four helix bundle protein [Candidatus Magasanikbacteria bacterium]